MPGFYPLLCNVLRLSEPERLLASGRAAGWEPSGIPDLEPIDISKGDLMPDTVRKPTQGVKHLTLALNDNTSFKDLTHILERVLTVPELPGIKGCAPCLSGLDRLVIENPLINQIR
jgi:hypothetical protein